jgi:diguanylate cyclase (GGDEF)-like protein
LAIGTDPTGVEPASPASMQPTLRMARRFLLALGPGGIVLAAVATAVGIACSIVVAITLHESLTASQFQQGQNYEERILAFSRADRQLMHAIENLSSGYLVARPGDYPVREMWRAFDRALAETCGVLDPATPNIDRLRQTCSDRVSFRAAVEPELLAFDPPARPLTPAVLHRLQELRADIVALAEFVILRTGALEDELAENYRRSLFVLSASSIGFGLSALFLLYLLGRASVRHFAQWHEAAVQHDRLESIVGSSGAPIFLLDRDLRLVLGNSEFRKLASDPANSLGLDPDVLARWRSGPLTGELLQPVHYTRKIVDAAGRERFFNVTATPLATKAADLQSIAFVAVDDTERRQAEEALIERGRYDRLTGLSNRAYFMERARPAIAGAVRSGQGYAMLCLGVDAFKDINATMGYAIGDGLLKGVAHRLESCLGPSDLVSRFGADEFVILRMQVADQQAAERFAGKLLDEMARPHDIRGHTIRSTVGIGLSVHDATPARAEVLVGQADMAMHRAKGKGHNTYDFFTETMDEEVRSRATLAWDLRDGLAAGQFFLVYQPRIDVESGLTTGVEALARWHHPQKGFVLPGLFVPVAESTGLIYELGLWVLGEACRQARRWLDAGVDIGRMAVNVSGLQIQAPLELERGIDAALADAGLSPDKLEIEITESALVEASRAQDDLLPRLRSRGITIAIDDFGTGYSSLTYVRHLPVDRIKIAQEFIQGITTNKGDASITRFSVRLARELGLDVVAEGVETLDQLAKLKEWGCTGVQGYLISMPLPAEELAPFLAAHTTVKAARR